MRFQIDSDRVHQIAQICHETNKAYCESIGDLSQPGWDTAPEWQKNSAIKGVIFHLNLYLAGMPVPPSASHNSWLDEKHADGWKYGPVKDPAKKEHPCFVPYNQLPVEQRLKDYLFGAICKAFFDAYAA